MQVVVRTNVMFQAVVDQLGITPQFQIITPEWDMQTERPMVAFYSTEGDNSDSARLFADVLCEQGFELWGHGGGKTLVFDGFQGEGGVVVWGKLPWILHELGQ